jgi:DNA-binding NarL/FixJ family response regulator
MKPEQLKVLLVDDHPVVRNGIRAILEQEGWNVCAEADNGEEAVQFAAEHDPDVAVVDWELRGCDGAAVTRQIKQRQPHTEVLIFTIHDDESLMREALAAGARSVILKSESTQTLVRAIESAAAHRPYFAPKTLETVLAGWQSAADVRRSPLTERERQIVRLLAEGKSTKETAQALGISVKTVDTHRTSIRRKLGVNSLVQLVRYAVREGIIEA